MQDKIKTMLTMQDKLNVLVCGKNWKDNFCENSSKPISWFFAILDESTEFLNSFQWKHWKDTDPTSTTTIKVKNGEIPVIDLKNAKMEVVDLWHFFISMFLAKHSKNLNNPNQKKRLIKEVAMEKERLEPLFEGFATMETYLEKMVMFAAQNEPARGMGMLQLLGDFIGLDFDEVFEIYIKKNTLNIFRQEHGYKEGTYKKIWNGKEDNECLIEILADTKKEDLTFEYIYDKLEEKYKTVGE